MNIQKLTIPFSQGQQIKERREKIRTSVNQMFPIEVQAITMHRKGHADTTYMGDQSLAIADSITIKYIKA